MYSVIYRKDTGALKFAHFRQDRSADKKKDTFLGENKELGELKQVENLKVREELYFLC